MRISDLRNLNICLLASWVQRYYDADGKLWKEIMDCKYNIDSLNIFSCKERNISPFFKRVLWATLLAKMGYKWRPRNGWFGTWARGSALQLRCVISNFKAPMGVCDP
jgi:hypothetical protein